MEEFGGECPSMLSVKDQVFLKLIFMNWFFGTLLALM
jgi:hypothetical protein